MKKRRILSMVLCVALALSLLPVGAFAASKEVTNTTIDITIDTAPVYQEPINESVTLKITGEWAGIIRFGPYNTSGIGHGVWATKVDRFHEEWVTGGSFDSRTNYALVFRMDVPDGYNFPKWEDFGTKVKFNVTNPLDDTLKPYKVEAYDGYTSVGGQNNSWVQVALWFHSRAYLGSWDDAISAPWSTRIDSIMDLNANGFVPDVAVKDLTVTKAYTGEPYYVYDNMGSDGKQKLEIWKGTTRLDPDDTLQANVDYTLRFCIAIIDPYYYSFCPNATVYVEYPIDANATNYKQTEEGMAYFEVPFKLEGSTLNQGSYTVDLREGMTEVYKDADDSSKAEALDNTLAKLKEEYALGNGDLDLDKDGTWDVRPVTTDGKLCWNPNPASNVHGNFVYSLESAQIKAFEKSFDAYYSSLTIKFVGKDLGEAIIDVSQGDYPFPSGDEGYAPFALAYLILAIASGSETVGFDLDLDGNDDVLMLPTAENKFVFRAAETTNLEGAYNYSVYSADTLKDLISSGTSVYSTYTFILPTKGHDLGDKLFNVTAEGLPINDPMAETELMLLASQSVIRLTGDYLDLDKDGNNDVELYDNAGVRSMRLMDTSNLVDQSYTLTIPEDKQNQYSLDGTDYYSTITFQFSPAASAEPTDLGALVVDVTAGKFATADEASGKALEATVRAISSLGYKLGDPATLDLDGDGQSDLRLSWNGGVMEVELSPSATATGEKTATVDKTAFMAITDNKDPAYYSSITFKLPGESSEQPFDPTGLENPFTDVKEGDYFFAPVLWAFYHDPQITDGMTDTTFGPYLTVTRGQCVTFLWRAMGKPEPTTDKNPFTDVPADQYYYKAVLWAVEKGITDGMTDTTFEPNTTLSTAHIITFLYRTLGIGTNGWYQEAADWAATENLMEGTNLTVDPKVNCPRGAVVTFLFRELSK